MDPCGPHRSTLSVLRSKIVDGRYCQIIFRGSRSSSSYRPAASAGIKLVSFTVLQHHIFTQQLKLQIKHKTWPALLLPRAYLSALIGARSRSLLPQHGSAQVHWSAKGDLIWAKICPVDIRHRRVKEKASKLSGGTGWDLNGHHTAVHPGLQTAWHTFTKLSPLRGKLRLSVFLPFANFWIWADWKEEIAELKNWNKKELFFISLSQITTLWVFLLYQRQVAPSIPHRVSNRISKNKNTVFLNLSSVPDAHL